jgi:hypothetical protein
MSDALSEIFKSGLFRTKKNPDRDWMVIAERAGSQLYGIVCEEFAHPEVALCALLHAVGEVILCESEDTKREKLVKLFPDAILACVKNLEEMEDEEPYEFEGEEAPEREIGDTGEPVSEPAGMPVSAEVNQPIPDGDDEDEGPEDPDPDEGFPEPWMPPKGAATAENPAKLAGFKGRKNPKGQEGKKP